MQEAISGARAGAWIGLAAKHFTTSRPITGDLGPWVARSGKGGVPLSKVQVCRRTTRASAKQPPPAGAVPAIRTSKRHFGEGAVSGGIVVVHAASPTAWMGLETLREAIPLRSRSVQTLGMSYLYWGGSPWAT